MQVQLSKSTDKITASFTLFFFTVDTSSHHSQILNWYFHAKNLLLIFMNHSDKGEAGLLVKRFIPEQ